MRDQTPSRTAAGVAAARAAGMLLPDEVRLADDPYGAAFASTRLQDLIDRARHRGPSAAVTIPGLGEWVLYMQVRTKVLDDAVRDFAAEGVRQLVILGAGYDCRALRLPELEDAATMYLTEPTIDASVRTIADYSARGSGLAMTYFNKARIQRPSLATRALASLVARVGEPWKWGWDPAELPAWMEQRGFQVTRDVSLADAARTLLPAELARRVDDADRCVAIVTRESIALASRRAP